MKRIITSITALIYFSCFCYSQNDSLKISTAFTTHVIFPTELTYADLSNKEIVAAKIIEQNKNILAVKAKCLFEDMISISALESNGRMHTFIVSYDHYPRQLILDLRQDQSVKADGIAQDGGHVSLTGKADAPTLAEVASARQKLYHIGARRYGIRVLCENIVSYSDITYIVLSLENRSSVSYNITDATFVVESKKHGRRTVVFEKTLFPRNRHGSLSTGAKEKNLMVYSFDKLTLSDDQVLKVYLYEEGGQRNLEMTIDTKDINKAANSL